MRITVAWKSAFRLSLIDKIYSAASGQQQWPTVLTQIADHVGAVGGMLAFTAPPGQQSFLISGRLDDHCGELYLKHHTWNLWSLAMPIVPPRKTVSLNSLVDQGALRRTAFHADVLLPQAIADQVNWLEPSLVRKGSIGGFGFPLTLQAADRVDDVARRLTPLIGHLSRSLDISLELGRYADGSRQLPEVLNLMPNAALLLDAKGCIMHANPAAETALLRGDGLSLSVDGSLSLTASLPRERQALAKAVAVALSVAEGQDAILGDPLRLSRPSGGAPLLVLIVPLPPPAFVLWQLTGVARALVLIVAPELIPSATTDTLRSLFGLTAAEARVAALVGKGMTGPQTAAALKVFPSTVKTHLSRSFQKIGVRNQGELVHLLSLLPQGLSARPREGS